VQALIAQYRAAQTLWLRQRDEILPLWQQRVQLLAAQYRAGQSELPEVLEARRSLLETRLGINQAEKEMAQSWAALRWLIPEELAE